MEQRNTPLWKAGLCAALLLNAGLGQAAGPPVNDAVSLTGWVHVEDLTLSDVVVEVVVNGFTFTAPVSEQGRFSVLLPPDAQATLHFEKEGHLTKEVLVDTHFARDSGDKLRRVNIAVIMELERHMGGLTYAGPVGTLGFEQGGGCIAVQHDKTRVLAPPRKDVMVF